MSSILSKNYIFKEHQKKPNNHLNFLFEKKCPEGKILNPKTGRFIIDRSKYNEQKKNKTREKKEQECPKGSYLKPSTQRCNKIETSSKIKKNKDKNTCPKERRPVDNKCVGDFKVLKLNKQNFECCYK